MKEALALSVSPSLVSLTIEQNVVKDEPDSPRPAQSLVSLIDQRVSLIREGLTDVRTLSFPARQEWVRDSPFSSSPPHVYCIRTALPDSLDCFSLFPRCNVFFSMIFPSVLTSKLFLVCAISCLSLQRLIVSNHLWETRISDSYFQRFQSMQKRSVVDVVDDSPDSSVVHFDPNDPKYRACCCCHAQVIYLFQHCNRYSADGIDVVAIG